MTFLPSSASRAPNLVARSLAFALVALCGATHAQHPGPLEIGLFGGDDAIWIYRQDSSPHADTKLLRFAYQMTGAPRYWAGPVVIGDVVLGTTTGPGLHVFFRDGTHRHYIPDPRIMRTGPPFADLGEVDAPGEKPPWGVCWDRGASCLRVVISAAQAAALVSEVPRTGSTVDPAAPATPVDTPFALARYASRRWTLEGSAPRDLVDGASLTGILSHDDGVHLVYADDGSANLFRHRTRPAGSNRWSEPTTFALPNGAIPMTLEWHDDTPVLLYREAAPTGVTIGSIRCENGAWTSGPALAKNAAEAQKFETPVTGALAGDAVAVGMVDPLGDLRMGTWSATTGGALHAPAIVPPLAPSLFPRVDPGTQHLLQYAILMTALGAVFVWRRDNVMVVIPVGEGYRYARFQHRVLALTLDLVILAPAWGLLLFRLMDQSELGITFTEQLLQHRGTLPPAWFWSWGIIGGVFAIYATVFEYWLGATPGKRILGCRVVAEHGQRCSFRTIFIRNAVRPIEFHFTAIALLVFLTPSRQRLGDILGGAIVVERADSAPPGAPDEADDDHADLVA